LVVDISVDLPHLDVLLKLVAAPVRKAQGDRPWHVYINYILQAGYHTPINNIKIIDHISLSNNW
jgi:hypothetical protein